jgi:AcrR family transcriptional regulator
MARDAAQTREQLVRAGERLFARHGVHGVSVREITELAGQRNASAIHYHFGSRDGLLAAINEKHLGPMDAQRSAMVDALEATDCTSDVRALVETIVVPMAAGLHSPEGRDYLRIVPQLLEHAGVRAAGGRPPKASAQQTRNLAHLFGCLVHLAEPLRRERIAIVLTMITSAFGDRARDVERDRSALIAEDLFLANLIDMSVAALQAPAPDLTTAEEQHNGVRSLSSGVHPGRRRARSRS